MTTARDVAYALLRAVDERDAYANLLMPTLLAGSGLDERDRAFAVELGYGTLRALGTLDHVLGLCSTRPVAAMDPAVRDVLRLGAYQLLRTRVAPHAAVSTSVSLARRVAGEGPAKFANAVLRKLAARDGDLGAPPYDTDPAGHLAIVTAHPRWIVEAFHDALGGDWAETRTALEADDARPEVHLVARPGRIDREALLRQVDGVPGPLSPYAVRLAGGDPAAIPAVAAGQAAVQDEGSQVAALALLAALGDRPVTVLDLCAGPGGKAALLAALLPAGSRLLATDLHPHRAAMVRDTLRQAGGVPSLVAVADATAPPWRPGSVDAVLLDAPCSGLGALRRRPEARWRRTPEDVRALADLQRRLLDVALEAVRPGGVVLYVVCSPHLAEGRNVVGGRAERSVQLWPHSSGTDAMFYAVVRKT